MRQKIYLVVLCYIKITNNKLYLQIIIFYWINKIYAADQKTDVRKSINKKNKFGEKIMNFDELK